LMLLSVFHKMGFQNIKLYLTLHHLNKYMYSVNKKSSSGHLLNILGKENEFFLIFLLLAMKKDD